MLLHHGTQVQSINETTAAAGTTSKEHSLLSDTALVTLWCQAVSGTLTLTIYNLTDTGKEVSAITFPVVSAPTTTLLIRRAAITTQRIRVEATYTGAATYEVYVRAVNAGLVDTRIVGATSLRMSSHTVTGSVGVLIPSSLTDRSGLVIKNWSTTSTIYLGAQTGEATPTDGFPLAPKDGLALDIAAGVTIYAVSDGGSADIRIAESGG